MSSESNEQIGFVRWWREKYPTILLFHIPNGSWRDIRTATRLKKEGVVAGIPDLMCPKYSLWIEFKNIKGGTISDEQYAMIDYLRSIGDTVIIGYGAEDASRKVLDFMKEMEK
jgi:hypothetical protein